MYHRPSCKDFIKDNYYDIVKIYSHLADKDSKDIFLRVIKSIETGDPGYIKLSSYPQYIHPIVHAEKKMILLLKEAQVQDLQLKCLQNM